MKRKRLFEIIEKSEGDDRLSSAYDIFMIIVITASLVPLAFKEENSFFYIFWNRNRCTACRYYYSRIYE